MMSGINGDNNVKLGCRRDVFKKRGSLFNFGVCRGRQGGRGGVVVRAPARGHGKVHRTVGFFVQVGRRK